MESKQFEYFNPKSLWKRANQPNFSSLVLEEFCWIISTEMSGTWEEFTKLENKEKNRSCLIPCWDHSRVKLTMDESAPNYIHANYVDGYEIKKKFICTQAPKINTLIDFYEMIWKENSFIVTMLVNVTSDCCKYWPSEKDNNLQVGQYTIRRLKKKIFSNYIVTELIVTNEFSRVQRKVYHFLYVDWTADGVPNDVAKFYKFVLIINRMRTALQTRVLGDYELMGPIIVHCSKGIGRTGVFCVVDYALHQLRKTGKVSLPKIVMSIRQQRHLSVAIQEQYFFCYRVLLHYLAEMNDQLRDEEKIIYLKLRNIINLPLDSFELY